MKVQFHAISRAVSFYCYVYAITLHQSYLECKTSKPVLCTVYKTGNRKQLWRKWSGKEIY